MLISASMTMKKIRILAFLWGISCGVPSYASIECSDIFPILETALDYHVRFQELSPELKKRWVEKYMDHVDPLKIFFSQQDARFIEASLSSFFDEMFESVWEFAFIKYYKPYSCDPIIEVHNLLIDRLRTYASFSKENFSLDIDYNLHLVLDPFKRERFRDEGERGDYYSTFLQYESFLFYMDLDLVQENAGLSEGFSEEHALELFSEIRKKWVQLQDDRLNGMESWKDESIIYTDFLNTLFNGMDNNSAFFTVQQTKEVNKIFEANSELYVGIGIGLNFVREEGKVFLEIQAVFHDGTADKSKALEVGDRILGVGDEKERIISIEDLDFELKKPLLGPVGTEVHLRVQKKSGKVITLSLVREPISLPRAQLFYKEQKGRKLALLRVPSFYRNISEDVISLLKKASKDKAEALLLDFSFNGGGLLEDTIKILRSLVPKVGLNGKSYSITTTLTLSVSLWEYLTQDQEVAFSGPIAILVNGASASASELLSGALKDYGRAIIIGSEKTSGKGSVQSYALSPEDEKNAFSITEDFFYLPSGVSPHLHGVKSHIVLPSLESTYDKIFKKYALEASPVPSSILPSEIVEGESQPNERVEIGNTEKWQSLKALNLELLREQSSERVAMNEALQASRTVMSLPVRRLFFFEEGSIQELVVEKRKKEEELSLLRLLQEFYPLLNRESYLANPRVEESINILGDMLDQLQGNEPSPTPINPNPLNTFH